MLLVVRRWDGVGHADMFVLFPVVTLGAGAWLADEALSAPPGAAVVVVKMWLGALSPGARRGRASVRAVHSFSGLPLNLSLSSSCGSSRVKTSSPRDVSPT